MFDQGTADTICERLSKGEPLAVICRDLNVGRTTVYDWQRDNSAFAERIAHARTVGFDAIADEILEIADDGSRDYREDRDGGVLVDHDHIQRSKLRVDTRLKLLSKWDPKRYGDKLLTENDTKVEVVIRDLTKG